MATNSIGDINFVDYKMAGAGVTFFIFDGRTAAPVLFWMLFPSWNVAYFCAGMMVALAVLNMNGISLDMGLRKIRRMLAGKRIFSRSKTRSSMIK